MRITFLTPRLAPAVCGLADHTRLLSESMIRQGGVEAYFLSCTLPPQAPNPEAEYWDLKTQPLWPVVRRQNPDWLWVQLSGYGYSRWGAPYRLGKALQGVRRHCPRVQIAICLHETHCGFRQLSWKTFWLSPWQRYTVGKIVRLGDLIFPTIPLWEKYALGIYGVDPAKVYRLPIGSNIPLVTLTPRERAELRRQLGWSADEVVALTFGCYANQCLALERFEPLLARGLGQGYLHRLACLGGESPETPPRLARWADRWGSAFTMLGPQSAPRVSALLSCADFGLAPTAEDMLEKSGAFMAYATAGLAVLALPALHDPTCINQTLPILQSQTWDWSLARSPHVAQLRQALREFAVDQYSWNRIAALALASLRKCSPDLPALSANCQASAWVGS